MRETVTKMTKIHKLFGTLMIAAILAISAAAAPSIDSLLASRINSSPLALTPVIIAFENRPTSADLTMLRSLGITGGRYLNRLPIILTSINRTQFNALKTKPNIRSLYANRTMKLMDLEGRTITGIENLIRDSEVTTRN